MRRIKFELEDSDLQNNFAGSSIVLKIKDKWNIIISARSRKNISRLVYGRIKTEGCWEIKDTLKSITYKQGVVDDLHRGFSYPCPINLNGNDEEFDIICTEWYESIDRIRNRLCLLTLRDTRHGIEISKKIIYQGILEDAGATRIFKEENSDSRTLYIPIFEKEKTFEYKIHSFKINDVQIYEALANIEQNESDLIDIGYKRVTCFTRLSRSNRGHEEYICAARNEDKYRLIKGILYKGKNKCCQEYKFGIELTYPWVHDDDDGRKYLIASAGRYGKGGLVWQEI